MAKIHLVFIPAWPAGHIASMLQFATKLLETSNNITITTLIIRSPSQPFSSTTSPLISSLSSSALDVSFHELPPADPPTNADSPEDFLSLYLQSHKPHLKHFVSSSSTPVSAIFIDLFATALLDVANELRIPSYVYFTSTSLFLALTLHLPTLEEKITEEFESVEGGIPLPGIEAIPGSSMPSPFMNKESKAYTWFVYHGRRYREAKGIVVNTFEELEGQVLRLLREGLFIPDCSTPKVFPVGPVLSTGDGDEGGLSEHECVQWLDQQSPGSVVFLCFGSMGCFDVAQVKEIAQGLEQSGHKFLWVLRSPPTSEIRQLTDSNPSELLPTGFLDRTKEQGLVWPSWAPQAQILAHKSIGGFVTHCGWNSCLESLWFGVPMLAWPLYAEQHLNELEMVRDLGVAVGMKIDRMNGNFVKGDELERGVRSLMGGSEDGKRVRRKVEEMRVASRKAVEDGGSSCVYMKKLVEDLVGED